MRRNPGGSCPALPFVGAWKKLDGSSYRRRYRMRWIGLLTSSSNGWMMVISMPCLRREELAWQLGM